MFMLRMTLQQVFSRKSYIILACTTSFLVFAFSTWLPNFSLIGRVIASSTATLLDKVSFLFGLLGAIKTNFTTFSAIYTIIIAVLFGVNVALVAYFFKRRKKLAVQGGVTTSFSGLLSGMFGIGCAACGTLVLSPIFSLLGAGGVLALLPFGGQEFGILGVGLLGFSIVLTSKKIQEPAVCTITNS